MRKKNVWYKESMSERKKDSHNSIHISYNRMQIEQWIAENKDHPQKKTTIMKMGKLENMRRTRKMRKKCHSTLLQAREAVKRIKIIKY